MTVKHRLGAATIAICCLVTGGSTAQDRAAAVSAEQNQAWADESARLALAEAARYEIRLGEQNGPMLRLAEKPALKWSNSNEATVHGSVLVWMHEGRPEAIASIYKFFTTKTEFSAEFHSLAAGPITVLKDGNVVWQPTEAGVNMRQLGDAGPCAKSATGRLVQMRDIARDFSAEVTIYSGTKHNLRLLPQPLVRYGKGSGELVDGAVFAYARATDPDVLLVLEARAESPAPPRWHYALARMHGGALAAWYRDKEVWSAPALRAPYFQKHGRYTTFMNIPEPVTNTEH